MNRSFFRLINFFYLCRVLGFVSILICSSQAADRFPSPDFRLTNHLMPQSIQILPRNIFPAIDIAMLFAALALATIGALKTRSRKWIVASTILSVAYFGFWRTGCICPVGSVQNCVLSLADNTYAVPLVVSIFFFLPLLWTLIFGRTFCGGVCPFGAMQDLLLIRAVRVPLWIETPLRIVPYGVLGLTILLAATGAGFLTCQLDPFVGFFRRSGPPEMIIYGIVVCAVATVIARPYCRFFCPYGVLLGWCARFSWLKVTIPVDKCINCRLCESACPVNAIVFPMQKLSTPQVEVLKKRRTMLMYIALPLLIVCCLLGAGVGRSLSNFHPTVALVEQLKNQKKDNFVKPTPDSLAFVENGGSITTLYASQHHLQIIYLWSGALLGFLFCLIALIAMHRTTKPLPCFEHTPDPGNCVACGRCFSKCPRNQ